MLAKLYDRSLLIFSIIVVTPLLILAFLVLLIGYPMHLVKKFLFS